MGTPHLISIIAIRGEAVTGNDLHCDTESVIQYVNAIGRASTVSPKIESSDKRRSVLNAAASTAAVIREL